MTARCPLVSAALLALLAGPAPGAASQAASSPDAGAAQAAQVAPAGPGQADACGRSEAGTADALDSVRAGLERRVCASARWFDGLFGDAREYEEFYRNSHGRLGLALNWDELDEFDVHARFRANLVLPQLDRRFNAVIGRDDPETFVNDSYDEVAYLPGSFSDDASAEWYAGVNYLARSDSRRVVDLGAGVSLSTPPNPYVKVRARHYLPVGEAFLLIPRATAFWENDDGFGVTLAADADWSLDADELLRWSNSTTFSEATRGVRWRSRLILYDAIDARSAVRYEASVQGETDGVQPDYRGLKVTYRRSAWREWLFLEFGGSLFWADDEDPSRRCDACVGASVGFEIMFGEKYGRSTGHLGPEGE
jgi:hypothetical protein